MRSLSDALAERDVVLDGGLATELEANGHDLRDALWSARLLRDDPQAIEDVHVAYFEAGADVAITASYHATLPGYEAAGIDREEGKRLLRRSVELAQRARERTGGRGLVAGSVGPYGVVFANGCEYTGDYVDTPDDRIAAVQRERIQELVGCGHRPARDRDGSQRAGGGRSSASCSRSSRRRRRGSRSAVATASG